MNMKNLTDEEIRRNVKNTLIQLRFEHKLTQTEVGKLVGKGKTAVTAWESGTSAPDIQTLYKLAKHYNKSIDYMYGLEEGQETNNLVEMKYTHDEQYPIEMKLTRGEYRLILELRGRKEIDHKTLEEMFNTILAHKQSENTLTLKDSNSQNMKFTISVNEFLNGNN